MKPLNPFNIDLEQTTLIEASAGTGKTYTITTLFCRLVAMGYPVESILVVTFTEAAAAELKLRIRARLFETLTSLLDTNCKNQDDELGQFLRKNNDKDTTLICQKLGHALNCFDQTSVMTIHSFCMKILKEHAFESRSFFDIELMPDRSLFLNQVSHDFFMTHVNDQDTLFLSYLNTRQITPQNFISSFSQSVSRKDLVIRPLNKSLDADFNNIFDDYRQALKKIHTILLTESDKVTELILNHNGINKRSYTKSSVPGWLAQSCKKLETKSENTLLKMTEKGDALYKFTQTRMTQKTKPGAQPPEHALFELCEELLKSYEIFENSLIRLKIEFLNFFNGELEKMKADRGICFFDDLVNDLAAVLEKKNSFNSLKLQNAVRQNYKACLIDEFQDTDPKQYEIFSSFFALKDNTPFFMIGDPKQAIYAFRGGDIFAYLKASKECEQSFTLEKNYRSSPLLVTGINTLFSDNINPFIFEQIEFSKVSTPAGTIDFLNENKKNIAPLQFCFIKRDEELPMDRQGFISKATASKIIPEIVAKDITALLESDKTLIDNQTFNSEKITPKDIAVLVRKNDQAQQIQKALSDYGVPSYLSKTGSVFDSTQAVELHDILWAVHNPDNASYIRTALCTSVFGFTSNKIIELNDDQKLLYQWQRRFASFKEIWESKGFVSMIMALFHHKDAFLKADSGMDERIMSNFYHLVELISQASLNQQLSSYYLLKWYVRQLSREFRSESSNELRSDELRLETDRQAVAIVTIHKSKGLEYPVVYLPYLWEGQRKTPQDNIVFHDPDQDYRLTLELGSKEIDTAKKNYEIEEKAEQRRLLYVALTRASAMCRIFWGGFNTIETSALGSMLHASNDCNDCKNRCKDDQTMINDLKLLQSLAPQSILIEPSCDESINLFYDKANLLDIDLFAKQTSRKVQASWKISSFSGISHNSSDPKILMNQNNLNLKILNSQNSNQNNLDINKKETLITLSDFPKGAESGDLFHSIFETLDFTAGSKAIVNQVQTKFNQFGFSDTKMTEPAVRSVKEVLETKLVTQNLKFCLKDIKPDQRFNEMEFIFPVDTFNISSIIKAFNKSDKSGKSDLNFKASGYLRQLSLLTTQSFKGFIKGFIDLVIHHQDKWYIVDYKSNYLGNTYGHYSHDAMFDAMTEHHYFLQYYIYTVALHRYLELRLKGYDYNTHFGGIFYLFIRGMNPVSGSKFGVFHDCPDKSVITELANLKDKLTRHC
ncbi:exodeoxyribonuclease V subunit beta [Desulfobacterales bacterium HSG17]|nr:exodeoxyribonuclease V subunit beta [Desulfobacterales bacterium HSG17]